ncbi:transcription termination factor 1-like [Antennarius striatus]|uniref:transcription termination factor 1-like n=1 Tax=Antennarius striatus TaxID=241820 RepID=UPI0035B05308
MNSPSIQKIRRSGGGVEECPSPVNIDTPQKTKKKKKQVEKESHLFLSDADGTPNQMKMKRKEQEEEGSQDAVETSETEMTKKKKKRRKEREEEGSQVEMEISETEMKKKKKKRRKEPEEEGSQVEMEISETEMKKTKKKRRKEQEECSQVEMEISETEMKKTKKKRRKEQEEKSGIDVETSDGEKMSKKKRKKEQEEEGSQVDTETSDAEKQKKTRKEQNEEGSQVDVETSETETKKKKKKKKRRKEQEEGASQQDVGTSTEKMRFKEEEEGSTTSEARQKKKKKRKEQEEEESGVDVEASGGEKMSKKRREQEEEGSQVDVETCETETKKKKKKKKRRKEQEEGASQQDVGSSTEKMWFKEEEEGLTTSEARQKKKNKRKEQEEEESGVDVEASGGEKLSEKRREQEEEGSQVDTENNDGEKKKKKKKRKEQEEEGSQVAIETSDAEMNREENNRLGFECLATTDEEDDISEVLLEELKEYVPNAGQKSINEINRLLKYDLHRFRAFRKQGISLRQGRFTPEENQRIRDNIENLLALTGISSANHLLFPYRFKEQEAMIRKLKVQHHFTERIAEGIPRPSKKVYNRAIKLFDETNHMGRFSDEELISLVKFQSIYGNNWKLISRKMDRSFYSLEKRFSDIASNHGYWSADEESRLKQVIKAHLEVLAQRNPAGSGLTRRQLCNKLPWTRISKHVKTRSWTQCRLKWFSLLRLKVTSQEHSNRPSGVLKFKICLINTLYNQNVDSMADIRWDAVMETIGDATTLCAQKCFHRLKVSKVPNWTSLSYGEIIDFLWANVVPDLEEKLAVIHEKEQKEQQEAQQEDLQEGAQQEPTFLLSHIFSSLDEDENFS